MIGTVLFTDIAMVLPGDRTFAEEQGEVSPVVEVQKDATPTSEKALQEKEVSKATTSQETNDKVPQTEPTNETTEKENKPLKENTQVEDNETTEDQESPQQAKSNQTEEANLTNETEMKEESTEQENPVTEAEAESQDSSNTESEGNFDEYPPLLITEISPNSEGGGTDYYEFFELYNNTNQPLSLQNYSFVYRYTNTGEDLVFQVPPVTLEPGEALVLWFNNGERTLQDFNDNFGTNLTSEQVVEYTSVFPGFSNGGDRAIAVKDKDGAEIISASYLGEDNDNSGADIHYRYPSEGTVMEKDQGSAVPTPGTFESTQVPATPVTLPDVPDDTEAPTIEHTPITESSSFSPVKVEATITDNRSIPLATLHFKEAGAENFTAVTMNPSAEDSSIYTAEVPSKSVQEDVVYYITATDGSNEATTEEMTISVETADVDFQEVPPLLVTEVMPDTSNIGGSDGYEFIEVYNNTGQPIDFSDYKLNYRYDRDPSRDVVWPSVPEDVVIPAGETLVFWVINANNGEATVADFNAHYGTGLVENEEIVRIYTGGMANGGSRGLVVKTNMGNEISGSYYNDTNVDDAQPNKGIVFTFPKDGSIEAMKVSAGVEDGTPGEVESYQVPEQPLQLEEDTIPPTVENRTEATEVDEQENIQIAANVEDDKEVVSVRLFYKTTNQADYKDVVLQKDQESGQYQHTIYSPELIGNKKVEYYFTVSDGMNEVTSETFEIAVTSDFKNESLRLNVSEKEVLSGNVILKGTSREDATDDVSLKIDGEEITDTYASVERPAYFALEVNGLNTYFKNAVTMGDEILLMMDKDWLTEWKTFSVPINPDDLTVGENTITVRSGNKASPYDLESKENRDNYEIRNVRLVLSDGSIVRDPNFADPTRSMGMNDGHPFEDFSFKITNEHAESQTHDWDTTQVADGEHVITVKDSDEEKQATILVDNTAPAVETTVTDGEEYKGAFSIDAEATDETAGVEAVKVTLDGEELEVPYETASSELEPGEHVLRVVATDAVGNEREEVVSFTVVAENPDQPELIAPEAGATVDGNPKLQVRVTDPTEDEMDVTFYKGYHYDPSQTEHVQAWENAADTEPPQTMVPEGEEAFSPEDIANVSDIDGKYLTTDSDTQFPYHRFEVTIDEKVDEKDVVELVWQGNSLEGRKVSMYAWSHVEKDWKLVTYQIAGKEDFELSVEVEVSEFVQDSKVQVLVQDEIPSSPEEYDYTFVWMSDTQYYAESYPHIFERQTQWIAENKDELKIEYVFHTGDLVDVSTEEYQWNHADEYMGTLDEHNIPYGVLAGNHDVGGIANDYTQYYQYFGEDRFEDKPYYGASYKNNRGHYDLISVGGNDYIMVYLGWDVTDEGIAWVNDVLEAHPDRKAILNFHEYLLATGTRHPLGEKLYNEIVVPNENVIAVLSGHYHEAQTYIDEIDDDGDGSPDRTVYQMLADYQAGPEGGQGYMRLLHFDQDNNRVIVNTFSPYMDDYNFYDTDAYPEKDEFTIDLDLTVQEKRIATDSFSVNVYTDNEIGKVADVPSGETAEVEWNGLEAGENYAWYAVAADEYTGEATSDIWTIVKGSKDDEGSDEEDENSEEGEERPVAEIKPKKNNGTATVHSKDLRAIEHGAVVTIDITNKKKKRRLLLTKKQVSILSEKETTLIVINGDSKQTFEMNEVEVKNKFVVE
ncbi:lamin tail domain-containing protein [Oceanobacillus senegalensis]|uniref:lamin tail domain-containing protein n=1 Tax=Oceanobacillus senegalensis TaxID=1936063 RepID=UPI001FE6EBAD|nr:lamin tail domain-containing protein [Oceanobacillus senegalensis]